jgi:4-hydroxy-3-methylbut-2-enyl diphosphate reductase
LQKKIRLAYQSMDKLKDQILIFGKKGHAEVNGLVGQTEGTAIVVESPEDLDKVDMNKNILLFSQPTKSIEHFREIIELISQKKSENVTFNFFDTICRQVANRIPNIRKFATQFDLVLFVTGRKSSNGKVLYEECRQVNPNTQLVYSTKDIQESWFEHVESVGICGATSTPIWLMEKVEEFVNKEYNTKTICLFFQCKVNLKVR